MEQQQEVVGVSRGQNHLHVIPEDASAAAAIVHPLLDRLDLDQSATQLLVVTSDAEAAAALAGRLGARTEPRIRVVAATEGRRSARVLRAEPAHVVLAPPATLVSLMESAVLKLDGVRTVVLAWVEDLGDTAMAPLESVMADVPKDAARFVLASSISPAVEQLVERYARRARQMHSAAGDPPPPVSLSYVATAEHGRLVALRRTLDTLDPDSAVIVTRDQETRAAVDGALRALGYGGLTPLVRVTDLQGPETPAALTVLYDLPSGENDLRRRVSALAPGRVVALVTPRQIPALRQMAGGVVTPVALPEAAARARSREESLRDELRAVLDAGQYSRELLTLEPLLTDHDGSEVAAAALRLLELQRAKRAALSAGEPPGGGPVTRLYVNVGSMDDVRPGDLVGAITNEGGISRSELGRVDVRDKHSTVEVATPVANSVVSKLTGVQIKGRRVIARVDEERPRERRDGRGDRPRERRDGDRGSRAGRPDRGERRGPPRDRGPSRERPPRDR